MSVFQVLCRFLISITLNFYFWNRTIDQNKGGNLLYGQKWDNNTIMQWMLPDCFYSENIPQRGLYQYRWEIYYTEDNVTILQLCNKYYLTVSSEKLKRGFFVCFSFVAVIFTERTPVQINNEVLLNLKLHKICTEKSMNYYLIHSLKALSML